MNQWNKFQGIVAWGLTHLPLAIMTMFLWLDADNRKYIFHYSAGFAVGFLIMILSLNPLRILFKNIILFHKLNRYRQQIGVAVFSYAVLHVACFISFKSSFLAFVSSVLTHSAFMPVGFISFPVLLVLAITSSQRIIRLMGFKRWKRWHKSVYLAEFGIVLHLILLKKWVWVGVLIPLLILQVLRWISVYRKAFYEPKLTNTN